MKRPIFVFFILTLFSAVTLMAASHVDLYAFMGDIPEWESEEPSGNTMAGMMVNASRIYSKSDSSLTLTIMKSQMAAGAFSGLGNAHISSNEAEMKIETIDGFQVTASYDKTAKSGCYVVNLNSVTGSMITLCFENLKPELAKNILLKYDWKKIQSTLNAIP